jgi:hypothetical protein
MGALILSSVDFLSIPRCSRRRGKGLSFALMASLILLARANRKIKSMEQNIGLERMHDDQNSGYFDCDQDEASSLFGCI